MSNELKLSGCQSALTKAIAELADARDENAALSDQTAAKDAVIRDGIKLWGPVAQTVIGTMWIEAARAALESKENAAKPCEPHGCLVCEQGRHSDCVNAMCPCSAKENAAKEEKP